MIKPPGEFFIQEIRKAVNAHLGCVSPLFHMIESGSPQLLGSSVLINISDSIFLCTAKHVLETAQSRLYINGPSELEVLNGEFYRSKQYDIAVLKLTPEQILSFRKYTALSEDHIANQAQTNICHYVEFIGYPETRNRVSKNRYKFPNRIYSFGCIVLQISSEAVRFKFNKKNKDAESRLRVISPNPHGVSGGPIMGVSLGSESTIRGNPCPRLIGIATDYPEGASEVFGPTAALLIATIKECWHISIPSRLDR